MQLLCPLTTCLFLPMLTFKRGIFYLLTFPAKTFLAHFILHEPFGAEENGLQGLLMVPAMLQQRRAVELVVCKASLLTGHWKAYLAVEEVV